uniref:Variant surface glycoprotein 1125.4700 n=1 Tax=Trypanosoma brucei TaxID=5691 RepID=A0A1J0RAG6_9TRYP|nr:variant surface glycoprotein 1125.4700 [Trypanosoma brucei]
MPNLLKLGSILALLLTFWAHKADASGEATINTAVDGFCAEQAYIQALAAELDTWTSASQQKAAELSDEAKMLALAALRYQQAEAGKQYLALAAVAQARAAVAAIEVKNKQPLLAAASTVLTKAAANLAGLHAANTRTLTMAAKGTATGSALGVLDSGSKYCTAEATATLQAVANCQTAAANIEKAKQAGSVFLTAVDFKIRAPADFKLDGLKVQTELKGTVNAGNTISNMNDAPGCVENGSPAGKSSSNAIGMKASYTTAAFAAGSIRPSTSAGAISDQPGDLSKTPILTTATEISEAIRKGRSNKPALPKLVSEETSNSIATDTTMAAYAKQMLQTGSGKNTPTATEDPTALAKQLFGGPDVNLKTSFIDKLRNDETKINSGASQITGNTEQLSKTNFGEAMAYFFRENTKKLTAAASSGAKPEGEAKTDTTEKQDGKKDGDNKTNATDCTGAEEGKCDKTKCDWNKEKRE